MSERNWAGNLTYHAARWHAPQTLAQLQETVISCERIKVLGSRHSFSDIADTTADIVTLEHFDHIVALDRKHSTVTVEAGIRYGTLCQWLDQQGYALHNLASLPHISVAGACITATHGSGVKNGNLSTAVVAMEMVQTDGELRNIFRDSNDEAFDGIRTDANRQMAKPSGTVVSRETRGVESEGMIVGLGGLGIVTKLTLNIEPVYSMRQWVYQNLPISEMEAHFDEIMGYAYSVSLFTDWQTDTFNQVWVKERVTNETASDAEPVLFGATLAERPLHPLIPLSAQNCTEQMGKIGAWHDRLPHFRMEFTPSNGEELQSEYFVPYNCGLAAMRAIGELRDQIAPHLFISEIRTVASDTLWMSPCYGQDCIGIHFTWKPHGEAVQELLPQIEARLSPFGARPHWGKLFTMDAAQLQPLYPRLSDFQWLLHLCDPNGKFHNDYLRRTVLPRG